VQHSGYSAFTQFCGFKVNSGEYKLIGLAPYGEPVYADVIREKLIDVKPDGSFRLNLDYFGYIDSLSMTNAAFEELFGGPGREPEARITRREMNLAASVQAVTEEVMRRLCRTLRESTGMRHLCLAGGWRSIVSRTGSCGAKGSSMASGSSRQPAMPAARSARP
jgi:carbamoyltransferase